MEERNELIKELFELHKLLADKGEISIGYGFYENYEILEAKVKKLTIPVVVSSLTAKDKLYLNTLLVNKLLEKEDDETYKAVNDIGIMDRVNDLIEKVNNS